jgi:hypothetical protein
MRLATIFIQTSQIFGRDLLLTLSPIGEIVMIFNHIGFNVTDFQKCKEFLLKALQPPEIGIKTEGDGWTMIGRRGEGAVWFDSFGNNPGPIHIASFAAQSNIAAPCMVL